MDTSKAHLYIVYLHLDTRLDCLSQHCTGAFFYFLCVQHGPSLYNKQLKVLADTCLCVICFSLDLDLHFNKVSRFSHNKKQL